MGTSYLTLDFLSSIAMDGHIFLRNLQHTVYTARGETPQFHYGKGIFARLHLWRSFRSIVKQAPRRYRKQYAKQLRQEFKETKSQQPPSPYEHPLLYQRMLQLQRELEEFLPPTLTFRPVVGTLPTGQVNAVAIAVPSSSDYVIAFQDGLFTFTWLLAKLIAQVIPICLPRAGTSDKWILPKLFRRISMRFEELYVAYLFEGCPGRARPYVLGGPQGELANAIVDAIQLFIFGHEYAHIYLGHLATAGRHHICFADIECDILNHSWQNEYLADINGFATMMTLMLRRKFDIIIAAQAAATFLHSIACLQQAVQVCKSGAEGSDSPSLAHPPPLKRREALKYALEDYVPSEIRENINEGIDRSHEFLERLMSEFVPKLKNWHSQGRQLATIWD